MFMHSKQFKHVATAVAASLALAFAGAANGAVDFFLKIDGIKGESTDKDHKDEIEIASFSWGASQSSSTGSGAGARAGKSCAQEFNFTKMVDKSSPLLAGGVMSGMVIPNAILIGRKSGGDKPVEYLQYEMKNVLISSYAIAGSGGSLPMDSFSLNFSNVTFEYKSPAFDATGDPVRTTIPGGC